MRSIGKLVPVVILLSLAALAKKEFQLPPVQHASAYPNREAHTDEKVTIAVEPYTSDLKSVFSTDYLQHGVLPVYIVFSNDGDGFLELAKARIELILPDRTRIEPFTTDDVMRRLAGSPPRRVQVPLPTPIPGGRRPRAKESREEIEAAQFKARAVEPKSSRAGFLFFDVRSANEIKRGARIYITGLRDGEGADLMYFEIPLDSPAVPSNP